MRAFRTVATPFLQTGLFVPSLPSAAARITRLAVAATALLCAPALSLAQQPRSLDRVFVVVMENHGFDQTIGASDPGDASGAALSMPFTTMLAQRYGLATYYFGVAHPSLPNYLAMIAGDTFGIHSDTDSCFAPDHGATCVAGLNAPTIVDQLEDRHIAWEALQESMPTAGFIGSRYPLAQSGGPELYAQKHDPFLYFTAIATNPARLQNIRPFDAAEFRDELNDPQHMPRYVFITPNQCHDAHGLSGGPVPAGCGSDADVLKAADAFLQRTVTAIQKSPSFTDRSAIFVVWDENDFSSNAGCCGTPGGGHVAAIVVTKNGTPKTSSVPMSHYALLATIEDGFGLPRLANAKNAVAMWSLFPDDASAAGD